MGIPPHYLDGLSICRSIPQLAVYKQQTRACTQTMYPLVLSSNVAVPYYALEFSRQIQTIEYYNAVLESALCEACPEICMQACMCTAGYFLIYF